MAKQKNIHQKNRQKTPLMSAQNTKTEGVKSKPKLLNFVLFAFLFLFSISLYLNTLNNEFVLDDAIAITENDFVKDGFSGIDDILTFNSNTSMFGKSTNLNVYGRYRPLSYLTFAIEYEFFGNQPFYFHLTNLILYGLTAIFLFFILSKLFQHIQLPFNLPKQTLPFVVSLLYVAHPLHTEVVANVKSRDEILAFWGMLATLWFTICYVQSRKWGYLLLIFAVFLLGLMGKENTLTFFVVAPLTVYFFYQPKLNDLLMPLAPMLAATAVFFVIRSAVTGVADEEATRQFTSELLNNPFVNLTFTEKYLTIFHYMLVYLRLLVFPHPLTIDYYPFHIPRAELSHYQPYLSLILYLAIGIIGVLTFKRKLLISYAIWFFLLTFSVYSNLFVQLGIFVNERFLYTPLLGFSIFCGALLVLYLPKLLKNRQISIVSISVIVVILLTFYSAKTVSRNADWKSNRTLFEHDVKISANSAFSNFHYGSMLLTDAQEAKDNKPLQDSLYNEAIKYLTKAVEVHPTYKKSLFSLGNAHCEYNQNFDTALVYYRRLIAQNSYKQKIFENLGVYLINYPNHQKKMDIFGEFYATNPENFDINYGLGLAYYNMGKNEEAKKYLEKAISLKPEHSDANNNLATVYYVMRQYELSLQYFKKAIDIQPDNPNFHRNLSLAYTVLGQPELAQKSVEKAEELEKRKKQ